MNHMRSVTNRFKELEGTFDCDLRTKHFFADGLYSKCMSLPKGYEALAHSHKYTHLSILAQGKAIVRTDDTSAEYTAPACIEIKAGIHHSITALEDVVWYCIHATDVADPSKVDEVLIESKE
jgi:mannose-6-phosphate isomerase-like protein (cupin superfamily)